MIIIKNRIPKYQIITDSGGKKYRFFCEASGAGVCTIKAVRVKTIEEELKNSWEEAKKYFNYCPKCGRWISDVMYNADVCECVDCAPWENAPKFCSKCRARIPDGDSFCRRCGVRVRYKEVWT